MNNAYAPHELATEQFYATGIERVEDYHGTYLNFGLWDTATNYLEAAENLIARVADKVHLNSESILLDVACGMGASSQFLKDHYRCKEIYGFDLTAKHIKIAKERNSHFPDVTYHQGNACHLPWGESIFTHAIAIEGPVHFNSRQDFMREAFRVLKPKGYLGLSDYSLARPPKNWWEKFVLRWATKIWHIPAINIYSSQEYANKLKEVGFENIEIDVVSHNVIPGYLKEQNHPEVVEENRRIRGPFTSRLAFFLNWGVDILYRRGLLDYILVSAQKP